MDLEPLSLDLTDIEAAAERIAPYARQTPVVESTLLNKQLGAQVFCKAEMLQRTGAFKFRGACNAIGQFTDEERKRGVLTYSSGNHGQAISRAAGIFGVPATVIMPFDAPAIKKAATAHWGATIVEYDRYGETRAEVAERVLSGIDGDHPILVPPYDHEGVMAGQGTVGLELCTQVPDLDLIFVCLGGGGLLSGVGVAAKALQPQARIIGVEPATGNDHTLSREAGERVSLPAVPETIADGQQTLAPGERTWPISDSLTDTFTVASDDEIVTAMRTLFLHHKLVAEPSGACALAGAMHRGLIQPGMRVGITLSGGNVDPAVFAKLVG